MKLSVSLPESDVEILDRYAAEHGLASRSAALQRAVRNLEHPDLERDYEAAWAEWADSGNGAAWETVIGDGLDDATR